MSPMIYFLVTALAALFLTSYLCRVLERSSKKFEEKLDAEEKARRLERENKYESR